MQQNCKDKFNLAGLIPNAPQSLVQKQKYSLVEVFWIFFFFFKSCYTLITTDSEEMHLLSRFWISN